MGFDLIYNLSENRNTIVVINGSFIVGGVVMVFAFLHDLPGLGFGDNLAPVAHNVPAVPQPDRGTREGWAGGSAATEAGN